MIYEFFRQKLEKAEGQKWEYEADLAEVSRHLMYRNTAFQHVWAQYEIGGAIRICAINIQHRTRVTVQDPETGFFEKEGRGIRITILATVTQEDKLTHTSIRALENPLYPSDEFREDPRAAQQFLEAAIETQQKVEAGEDI